MSKDMFLYCLILIFLMAGICNFANGITANNVRKEYYRTGIKILSRAYDKACKTEQTDE